MRSLTAPLNLTLNDLKCQSHTDFGGLYIVKEPALGHMLVMPGPTAALDMTLSDLEREIHLDLEGCIS